MSDPSMVRQRFNESNPTLLMAVDEEDGTEEERNDDDELKPLTPNNSSGAAAALPRRKLSGRNLLASNFMISQKTQQQQHRDTTTADDNDDNVTCFGDLWRLVASLLLSLVLVLPFLYSFYQYNAATTFIIPTYPADLLQCAQDYSISFALLHRQVERSSNYCDSTVIFGDGDHKKKEAPADCTCTNPLVPLRHVPTAPQYFSKWDETHQRNDQLAAASEPNKIKVVLYGDSITEHWVGTDLGVADQETMSVKRQFDIVFDDGQAVALGLAGDRCPQLLYRLQHGELPPSLDPSVIWLLIGTNDQVEHCSPESILIGILNIAQYLQEQRPNARIVLNSLLPKPNPTSREWKGTKYYNSITWINQRLACYAQGSTAVEYFDASWLFVMEGTGTVPKDLMPDGLHPSGKGSRIWAEEILKRVEDITEEQQVNGEAPPES